MRRVAAISWIDEPWTNIEIGKDCGLIPYLLHKNHGCDVTIVTGPGEDYPVLKYMDGLKLIRLSDNSLETRKQFITEQGKDIDLLMFYGVTGHNILVSEHLRAINPNCMMTCSLDMNAEYADRIPFYKEPYFGYFDNLDLMWQSNKVMTDFLNEKWCWNVECGRNGYYNLETGTSYTDYVPIDQRENIIVYVGRIDEVDKVTSILLNSFAAIADSVPDWKLKLVGPVEKPFDEFVDKFMADHADLQDRIIFTGNINDRGRLHKEYESAKIFATSTRHEGGPNAWAEAMCAGNVMAVTRIDAYKDFIGNDECGLSCPIDDEAAFTEMLLKLCTECDLDKMSRAAFEIGRTKYNFEKVVEDIYGKLCDRGF